MAGVPSPRSFIASESSFSSRILPADSIAVSSVASVSRRGGLVFFETAFASSTFAVMPFSRPPGKVASSAFFCPRLRGVCRSSAFQPCCSTAVPELVKEIGLAFLAGLDRRDDVGHGQDVVVMPSAQQPPANQIIDLALVRFEIKIARRLPRGDDRVMVGHFRVVDEALAERLLARPVRHELGVRSRDRVDHAPQPGGHGLGKDDGCRFAGR